MGVFLLVLAACSRRDEMHLPERWQPSKECYEGHQRHRHGEDDDVACKGHDESSSIVLGQMRHMTGQRVEASQNMAKSYLAHVGPPSRA
jgi:hypothetical protein